MRLGSGRVLHGGAHAGSGDPAATLSQRNVLHTFEFILERAGLPDMLFHALRHTPAMTLDSYSHLDPSMGRAAADKLDALLS